MRFLQIFHVTLDRSCSELRQIRQNPDTPIVTVFFKECSRRTGTLQPALTYTTVELPAQTHGEYPSRDFRGVVGGSCRSRCNSPGYRAGPEQSIAAAAAAALGHIHSNNSGVAR